MTDRNSATSMEAESDKRRDDELKAEKLRKERPERHPEADTLEGPGDRHEAEGESDARDTVTRRGES